MTIVPAIEPMTEFERHTAVEQVGPDQWRAQLHDDWSSLVGIHGGYGVATTTRAIVAAQGEEPRPLRTVSAQFLRSLRPGPADITVRIDRRGRGFTFASARLSQQGRDALLVRTTSAPAAPGLRYDDHRPRPRPAAPPPSLARFASPFGRTSHFDMTEVTLDPDVVPFSGSGRAWIAAWLRPLHGDPVEAAWLVMAGDVLPPASFSRTTGPTRAATLDYTVHLAVADPSPLVPAGEHVYLDCISPLAQDGIAVEDGVLWGPGGEVLAVARQTRLADDQAPRSMA
jgi:acyl-CoA thioesterase